MDLIRPVDQRDLREHVEIQWRLTLAWRLWLYFWQINTNCKLMHGQSLPKSGKCCIISTVQHYKLSTHSTDKRPQCVTYKTTFDRNKWNSSITTARNELTEQSQKYTRCHNKQLRSNTTWLFYAMVFIDAKLMHVMLAPASTWCYPPVKPSFHYPSSRAVNSGSGNRALTWRQTAITFSHASGYLPILLGDRGIRMWTTCPWSLRQSSSSIV